MLTRWARRAKKHRRQATRLRLSSAPTSGTAADLHAKRPVPIYADVTDKPPASARGSTAPGSRSTPRGGSSRILFPFFGRYDDAHEHDTYVFPTFFRQRKTDGTQLDTFFPLFWHSRYQGRTTRLVGLWYDAPAAPASTTPAWCRSTSTPRTTSAASWSSRRCWSTASADFTTTPCHVRRAHRLPHARSHRRTRRWSSRSGGRDTTRQHGHRVLFPIYWHFEDGEARTPRSTSPARSSGPRTGPRTRAGSHPIAWRSHDSADRRRLNAFMPLFYESSGPNASASSRCSPATPARDLTHLVRAAVRRQRRDRAALPDVRSRSGSATTTRGPRPRPA